MKIEDLTRPGIMVLAALGAAGLAATALAGFAAGVAVSRDPEGMKRKLRRVAQSAARGLEQATLAAAQAREQIGDLWAEAREEALAEVDAADFDRAAATAGPAEAAVKQPRKKGAAEPARRKSAGAARKRARPRAAPPVTEVAAAAEAPGPAEVITSPSTPAP
jgi:hypothetical protein